MNKLTVELKHDSYDIVIAEEVIDSIRTFIDEFL